MNKQLRVILTMLILAVSFFLNVSFAYGDVTTVKVGIYDDPPIVMKEEGVPSGIYPRLFESMADKLGVKYEYYYGSWDDIFNRLKSGELDMVYDIADSKEREAFFDFNQESILSSWSIIYSRKGQKINSMLDLNGKRIAVVKNDISYEGQADSLKETLAALGVKCTFVEFGGFTAAISAAENNQADACVVNRFFAEYKMNSNHLLRTPIVYKPIQLLVAFKKDSKMAKLLIPKIDANLSMLKSNPQSDYFKVMDSYFVRVTVVNLVPTWFWGFVLGLLIGCLILFTLIHNFFLRRKVKHRTYELQEANRHLEEISNTDELTGLYNRRAFGERLRYEIARARRYKSKLSIIMMDLDHFKRVNDTYGHGVGDKVLVEIGQVILRNIREVDLSARIGGEEFVVILPETGLEEAAETAEKIRISFESVKWEDLGFELKVTVTCGVAEWDTRFIEDASFVESADQALYRGKEEGRNRVSR